MYFACWISNLSETHKRRDEHNCNTSIKRDSWLCLRMSQIEFAEDLLKRWRSFKKISGSTLRMLCFRLMQLWDPFVQTIKKFFYRLKKPLVMGRFQETWKWNIGVKWVNRLLPTNYLSVYDHFVGLALKGLTGRHSIFWKLGQCCKKDLDLSF